MIKISSPFSTEPKKFHLFLSSASTCSAENPRVNPPLLCTAPIKVPAMHFESPFLHSFFYSIAILKFATN